MYASTHVSKEDLRLLRGLPEKTRLPILHRMYDAGRDIGRAVADAYREGVNVIPLIEEMFADCAISFGLKYENGWVLYCLPVDNCAIPIRASQIVNSRARKNLDHEVWYTTGIM